MVREEFELKEVTKNEKVLISRKTFCDMCGEEIATSSKKYYKGATHHDDWGNDSIDSYEEFDVCGSDCATAKFKEYLESGYFTKKFEIHQTGTL